MKDEQEKNDQEDNSVVSETKVLTEKYEALCLETKEKTEMMTDMLTSKDGKAESVTSDLEV